MQIDRIRVRGSATLSCGIEFKSRRKCNAGCQYHIGNVYIFVRAHPKTAADLLKRQHFCWIISTIFSAWSQTHNVFTCKLTNIFIIIKYEFFRWTLMQFHWFTCSFVDMHKKMFRKLNKEEKSLSLKAKIVSIADDSRKKNNLLIQFTSWNE